MLVLAIAAILCWS